MNLGIVIAVSEYGPNIGSLPACKNDAKAIKALLQESSKFDEILVIDNSNNTSAASVKTQLTKFISLYQDREDIDEIFFYYSGHGEFIDGELYFLLSDYEPKRRKQTSLENSEMDNLLRTMSPKLAVKFIDTCFSGVSYIKEPEGLNVYLKGTQKTFKNCYFLFSSQNEQQSYQDVSLSFFTRSFVDAILQHPNHPLRYKDIIDFISDTFQDSPYQTPFFVIQAGFVEQFCVVTPKLKSAIMVATGLTDQEQGASKNNEQGRTLIELIIQDSARYCTEEEAYGSLDRLKDISSFYKQPNEIEKIYSISITVGENSSQLPDTASIGVWLERSGRDFFAKPILSNVTKKVRNFVRPIRSFGIRGLDDPLYSLGSGRFRPASTSIITGSFVEHQELPLMTYRPSETIMDEATIETKQITGYKPTIEMPFYYFVLQAEPKYPNIPYFDCFIAPILSKTDIQLFFVFSKYRDNGWTERVRDGEPQWETVNCSLKDFGQIQSLVISIIERFWRFVLNILEKQFGTAEPPADYDDINEQLKLLENTSDESAKTD